MGVDDRRALITSLEEHLDARVIAFVTGDRKGLETRLAADIVSLMSEHLTRIGQVERLAVYLYTRGGDSIAAWSLVNLFRQYCDRLMVLVPFRALSAGTLIALGADDLYMGRHAVLSPVDPSVTSPYNPQIQIGGQAGANTTLPVSVEDMLGFIELARDEVKIESEQGLVEIVKLLATKVHPLALGAVYRARAQSGDLAKRLLLQHFNDPEQVDLIVNRLTTELPTHSYSMGRNEVRNDLQLPLADVDEITEDLIWRLYLDYAEWMKLTQPYSAELDLNNRPQVRHRYERAALESVSSEGLHQYVFTTDKVLLRVNAQIQGTQIEAEQVAERTLYEGWLGGTNGEFPQWS